MRSIFKETTQNQSQEKYILHIKRGSIKYKRMSHQHVDVPTMFRPKTKKPPEKQRVILKSVGLLGLEPRLF